MKLDGALKPHGAPAIGSSIGARRCHFKRSIAQTLNIDYESKSQPDVNQSTVCNVFQPNLSTKTSNGIESNTKKFNSEAVLKILKNTNDQEFRAEEKENILKVETGYSYYPCDRTKNSSTITMMDVKKSKGWFCDGKTALYSGFIDATAKIMMRAAQSLVAKTIYIGNVIGIDFGGTTRSYDGQRGYFSFATFVLYLSCVIFLLPNYVICDEPDNNFFINTFSMGPETATTEFDYASRGKKKYGDKCENTLECGFPGSICDPKKKSCQCTEDLPITNHIDKCGKEAAINESCFFNEQCESFYFQTECRDGRCICRFEMSPILGKDGVFECKGRGEKPGPGTYIDPAMIGVLVGMALMFIIICVVLRLFSQARWRENRTIFNTPNPRLMNVSLLRDSKLLHGQERRGSRMSVRAPSRQPSMASLRPHSPNPSLGRMTRSKSNTRSSESRPSDASNCSRILEHAHAHLHSHAAAHGHINHVPSTSAATTTNNHVTSPGANSANSVSIPISAASPNNTKTNKF